MRSLSLLATTICWSVLLGCHAESPRIGAIDDEDSRPTTASDDDSRPTARDGTPARDGGKPRAQHDGASEDPSPAPIAQQAERPSFCARPGGDAVHAIFCGDSPAQVRSLRELQDLIQVNPRPPAPDAPPPDPSEPVDPYSRVSVAVFLAHSTALSGKLVSPINPRAIIIGRTTTMAFQRGVQEVELASFASDRDSFAFYLLSFRQACNERPEGCLPGDLYTPRIESDWTSYRIADDEQLKNTPSDCRQCHQRARERPLLLMRELSSPWTHFFEMLRDDDAPSELPGVRGRDLVGDYLAAKGDEPYAAVPVDVLRRTIPLVLENMMELPQPLLFDAPAIEDERWPLGADGFAEQPLRSPTWDRAYEAFKRGEQLPLPYFEPRVTDLTKQTAVAEAYRAYQRDELSADELPDLAQIFPDDPKVRAELGFATEPDASPAELLVQACGACHNDVLDQSISRARFNIDLRRMDRAELELAIERLSLSRTETGVMPPPEARELDDAARERLIAYLRSNERSSDDDALLERAARLGMAGGER